MPSVDFDEDIVGPIAESLITEDMSDVERAEVLHDWIVGNIDFGYETLMKAEDPYRLRSTRECLEQHEGNCIEQSLMWLAMAEVVGIKRPYLVISYGAPSALISIAAVGGGATGTVHRLIRTMLTLALPLIMWYEQRTRRQSPGDRHYFNAVRDDDGRIHAFDISYRVKGALPVLRTNWTFLEPKSAHDHFADNEHIARATMEALIRNPVIPVRVTSTRSEGSSTHEIHHLLRGSDGAPHIKVTVNHTWESPRSKIVETLDIRFDHRSLRPVHGEYSSCERRQSFGPFMRTVPMHHGEMVIKEDGTDLSGDEKTRSRMMELYRHIEGLSPPTPEFSSDGNVSAPGTLSIMLQRLALIIRRVR